MSRGVPAQHRVLNANISVKPSLITFIFQFWESRSSSNPILGSYHPNYLLRRYPKFCGITSFLCSLPITGSFSDRTSQIVLKNSFLKKIIIPQEIQLKGFLETVGDGLQVRLRLHMLAISCWYFVLLKVMLLISMHMCIYKVQLNTHIPLTIIGCWTISALPALGATWPASISKSVLLMKKGEATNSHWNQYRVIFGLEPQLVLPWLKICSCSSDCSASENISWKSKAKFRTYHVQ